ncbi:MAG: PAS domain-containing sensor histidine kinase, partial [Ferruginibacter sp.]
LERGFEQERQRFNDMFVQAPSIIGVLKGPQHLFEMTNPLYLELIGNTDVIGKPVKEVMPEMEELGFMKILDGVFETGQPFSANEMPVKLDNKHNGNLTDVYLNIIYQAYRNNVGKIEGIFFFAVNVTEQVLSRKKIEESERQYRRIVETAQEGIWIIDKNNRTTFANKKLCEIVGYSPEEMIGKENTFFMDQEGREIAAAAVNSSVFGTNKKMDISLLTRDGKKVWVTLAGSTILDQEGQYDSGLAMVTDITELKFAETERVKMVTDLMLRNNDLEQFAYIVSHNLRAPIANILGASNVLNEAVLTSEKKRALNQGLSDSVTKLDEVIKDLNHILQVKGGINEIKEMVLFSKLVEDIKISIKNLIDKNDVEIEYDFSQMDELLTLKSYLYSIFYNLISNSIKYRRQNVPCKIEIKSHYSKNTVALVFADNGMGIDLQKKGDQVFGLYKRFHTNVEGKGMGLFMVKTQVETLGGKISIESEVNKGTTFTIKF